MERRIYQHGSGENLKRQGLFTEKAVTLTKIAAKQYN